MSTALSELRSSRDLRQTGDKDDALPAEMLVEESETALRIAFVYSRIPFPLMRGDQLTVAHLISFLSARGHSIDFYSLDCGGHMSALQSEWLSDKCASVQLFRQSKLRSVVGIIRGLFAATPAQVGYFGNRELDRTVAREIESGKYDIVYTYYIRSAQAIPRLFAPNQATLINGRKCASFLALQLSQYLNVGRMAGNEKSLLRRLVYRLEQKLLARYEGSVWQWFTKTCLIGAKDVEAVKSACRASSNPLINNVVYNAHGTDIRKFRISVPEDVVEGRIVFSGNMGYRPNIEAIAWFFENCWRDIKKRVPTATLMVVGRDPSPEVLELAKSEGVEVTGTVEDVGSYIRSASVCINPMQAAGGMQNKLVEYLASGAMVVATTVANEGVNAPQDALLILDSPAEICDAVVNLLQNPESSVSFRQNARKYAEEHWTWESHFLKLEANFFEALK